MVNLLGKIIIGSISLYFVLLASVLAKSASYSNRGLYLFETALKSALPEQYDSEIVYPKLLPSNDHPSCKINQSTGHICLGVITVQRGLLIFAVRKVGKNLSAKIVNEPVGVALLSEPMVKAKILMTLQSDHLYEGLLWSGRGISAESYPVSLIFHGGKMHTIFNIEDHQFAIYPISKAIHNITKPSGEVLPSPHYIVKYLLENGTILIKDSPDASKDETTETVVAEPTAHRQKINEDDILKVPHLIEGVLFIDERDIKNISEETIALIGEKITKYFDVLAERVNIRFKLVDWFSYPAELVVENDMIGCQRRLEKHISKHKFRDTYDVGMLISTKAIEKIKTGFIVGWANVGAMCKRTHSALVSWYKPTSVAHFLAHELTHLLNSYHDEEEECESGSQLDDQPKMDPKTLVKWSNCTIKIISERVKSRKLDCLLVENFKRNSSSKF